jgi:hypothetical protein
MSGHKESTETGLTPTTDERPEAEKLVSSIVPWPRDDARSRYLGLRSSGFTIREALKLIGYVHSALSRWRLDPAFVQIENRIPEYRKELSMEYANLEFLRNYRLVLEKDFRILKKSLEQPKQAPVAEGEIPYTLPVMSKEEQDYLLKMRGHYTPQQLQIVQALVTAPTKDGNETIDFTKFVIEASRISERVRIESKGRMPAPIEITGDEESDGA